MHRSGNTDAQKHISTAAWFVQSSAKPKSKLKFWCSLVAHSSIKLPKILFFWFWWE
jgi:hypothetical protein